MFRVNLGDKRDFAREDFARKLLAHLFMERKINEISPFFKGEISYGDLYIYNTSKVTIKIFDFKALEGAGVVLVDFNDNMLFLKFRDEVIPLKMEIKREV